MKSSQKSEHRVVVDINQPTSGDDELLTNGGDNNGVDLAAILR